MCACALDVCLAAMEARRGNQSYVLKLRLQTIVSHHVGPSPPQEQVLLTTEPPDILLLLFLNT